MEATDHKPIPSAAVWAPLATAHLPAPGSCKLILRAREAHLCYITPRVSTAQFWFIVAVKPKRFMLISYNLPTPLSALLLFDIYCPVKRAFIC